MTELNTFIEKARGRSWTDEQIRTKLLASGWQAVEVDAALGDDLVVPSPTGSDSKATASDSPTPLSKNEESIRLKIFEYNMMFLTLWIAVISTFVLINAILFDASGGLFKFPLTALIVSLPVFLVLFSRTRAMEHQDEEIKHIAARLQLVQATQNLSFIVLLLHAIYAIYQVISGSDQAFQQIVSFLFSLGLFGSLFAYYWQDTHQASAKR